MDEHEILIEYSEMTTFNFNSKEYQEIRKDYIECKNTIKTLSWTISNFLNKFIPTKVI